MFRIGGRARRRARIEGVDRDDYSDLVYPAQLAPLPGLVRKPGAAYFARVPCHAVACPICDVPVGQNCRKRDGSRRFSSHKARCLAAHQTDLASR
jgi:hypothetical protein